MGGGGIDARGQRVAGHDERIGLDGWGRECDRRAAVLIGGETRNG